MSRDWTSEELQAVSAAMKKEGHMSYEEFCEKMDKRLRLTYLGRDSWDRPVYECGGRLYVDTDPRKGHGPDICTKHNNEFDGEPCAPIPDDMIVEFIPGRDTW